MEENFIKRTERWANLIIAIFGVLILTFAVWSRGLFFQEEFLTVHIMMGVVGFCYLPYIFNKNSFKMNVLDWVFLYFGIIYSISIFGSANVNSAIGEALRVWTYVLFYFILSRALTTKVPIKLFTNGLILISTSVSVFGILTVPGIFIYEGASVFGMLNSTFQYHNAFAGFLIAPMILTIYFWQNEFETWWRGAIYSIAFILMSIGFAGSQSRGGYIIFFLAMIAFFIVNRVSHKGFILLPILNVLVGVFIWGKFLSSSTDQVVWLVAGVLGALIVHFGGFSIGRLFRQNSGSIVKPLLFVVSFVLVAVGIYEFIHSGGTVLDRMRSINIHDHAVEERFTIYGDSLKMLIQSPFTGFGGGGWAAAYRAFSSYYYNSTETHSIILKIIVETGLLGIIALITLPIAIIKMFIKTQKQNKKEDFFRSNNLFSQVILIGIFGIVGHALIDFNLSEGSLSMLLWGMFAILRGFSIEAENNTVQKLNNEPIARIKDIRRKKSKINNSIAEGTWLTTLRLPLGIVFGLIGVILILVPFSIKKELQDSASAQQQLKQGNFQFAINLFDSATNAFPFQASDWDGSSKARIQLALNTQDFQMGESALNDSNRAVALSKYDALILNNKASILGRMGRDAEVYQTLKKVVSLAPLQTVLYSNVASEGLYYAMNLIKSGDLKTAKEVAQEVMSLPEQINNRVNSLSTFYRRNWVAEPLLEVTPVINLASAQAKVLLGREDGQRDLMTLLSNSKTVNDAQLWLGALALSTGNPENMKYVTNAKETDLKKMQDISSSFGRIK